MARQYATTRGHLVAFDPGIDFGDGESMPPALRHEASDPVPPAGDGWEMCGAAATSHWLYWFWVRTVFQPTKKKLKRAKDV